MRCTICSKKISKYNYAVFDKKYHCLPCFLQTYGQTPLVQTEYQSCGSRPLSLSRTNSYVYETFYIMKFMHDIC